MQLAVAIVLGASVALSAQQPATRNAQVETRRVTTSLDREIAAIAATSAEPLWVGWREAAAPGIVSQCAAVLDGSDGLVPPTTAADVVVMLRITDHAVERVRTFAGDCPIDAGGRRIYWLDGVSSADSVKYLRSLIVLAEPAGAPADLRRRLNSGATSAIGQHRDDSVDTLVELAKQSQDTTTRASAFNFLGRSKDPKAVAFIDGILKR